MFADKERSDAMSAETHLPKKRVAMLAFLALYASCKVRKIEHRAPTSSKECEVFVSKSVEPVYRVEGALDVPAGCNIEIDADIEVGADGSLTLEKGVTLRFRSGKSLNVGGTLLAKGAADALVTLTSAESTPGAGDWEGVVFHRATSATTSPPASALAHAHISYAGPKSTSSWSAACVTVLEGMSVEITDSTIEHCKSAGVAQQKAGPGIQAFSHDILHDNGTSVDVDASVVSLLRDDTLGDPIRVTGTIGASQKWQALGVPVVVAGTLAVESASKSDSPAILELADGTTLRFLRDARLRVGSTGPGAIVAHRAKFTSAHDQPQAGDWSGIELGEYANGTKLSDSTIEYAGAATARTSGAALRLGSGDLVAATELHNLTFRETYSRSVAIRGPSGGVIDCEKLSAAGNLSVDVPLCDR
jgi:hypothetical protein